MVPENGTAWAPPAHRRTMMVRLLRPGFRLPVAATTATGPPAQACRIFSTNTTEASARVMPLPSMMGTLPSRMP